MKLYELTGAFNDIFNLLESDEEVDLQTLEDTLQSIEGAIEQKAGGIARIILSLQKTAEAFGSEAQRLAEKKRTTENKVKWLKDYLIAAMTATAKEKILTDVGTVSRRKSPASIKVLDPFEVPASYWYTPPPELDKKSILEDLKRGASIPGVELHQGYHIRIQ